MSKLLKLKRFFTLKEASKYLSSAFEENVSVSDIYSFALDRHLTLSVKFNSVIEASVGYEFAESELPYRANESNSFVSRFGSRIFFEDGVMITEGIFDLSLFGREFMDLNRLYMQSIGEVAWECSPVDSVILKKNGFYYKLKGIESQIDEGPHVVPEGRNLDRSESRVDCRTLNYYAHTLVIRKEELDRFISAQDDEAPVDPIPVEDEKPLATRERNTLLTVIGALLKEQGITPSDRGVASAIQLMTETIGSVVSENTIRKILGQISDITS
ncbi:hypothetical protein ACOIPL_001098 [Vibrio fluvialis]|nr:hypothetical protein [Vibrio fluvialis]ELF6482542.1 hypothetical protein [Vibrio fluvialis]ELG4656160.1 hypothetical protein [Vibrio fluvialis]